MATSNTPDPTDPCHVPPRFTTALSLATAAEGMTEGSSSHEDTLATDAATTRTFPIAEEYLTSGPDVSVSAGQLPRGGMGEVLHARTECSSAGFQQAGSVPSSEVSPQRVDCEPAYEYATEDDPAPTAAAEGLRASAVTSPQVDASRSVSVMSTDTGGGMHSARPAAVPSLEAAAGDDYGDDADTEPTLAPASVVVSGHVGTLSLQVVSPLVVGVFSGPEVDQQVKTRRSSRQGRRLTAAERRTRLAPDNSAQETVGAVPSEPVKGGRDGHGTAMNAIDSGSQKSTVVGADAAAGSLRVSAAQSGPVESDVAGLEENGVSSSGSKRSSTDSKPTSAPAPVAALAASAEDGLGVANSEGAAVAGLAAPSTHQPVTLARNYDSLSLRNSRRHVAALAAGHGRGQCPADQPAVGGREQRPAPESDKNAKHRRRAATANHLAGDASDRRVPDGAAYSAAFVVAVLLTYLLVWPVGRISTVAVDITLACAGFAIARYALRLYVAAGAVGLGQGLHRAISRLGPVSFVALSFGAFLTWWKPGPGAVSDQARELAAATLGLSNLWAIAVPPGNDLHTARSAVEHFWLPSTLWQAAFCWFVLILVVEPRSGSSKRLRHSSTVIVAASALAAVAAYFVWPSVGLYSPLTRMFAFFVGAATVTVCTSARSVRLSAIVATGASVAGAAGLVVVTTMFPTTWAISLLASATTCCILAVWSIRGRRHEADSPGHNLSTSIHVGYSAFVLLWPTTIAVSKVSGDRSWASLALAVVFTAIALSLGHLSRRAFPTRGYTPSPRALAIRLGGTASGALALAVAFAVLPHFSSTTTLEARKPSPAATPVGAAYEPDPRCFGARALPAGDLCRELLHQRPNLQAVSVPTPKTPCAPYGKDSKAQAKLCSYGEGPLVAWWGDDELRQWSPALQQIAQQNKWRVLDLTSNVCKENPSGTKCNSWLSAARDIINEARPTRVIAAASAFSHAAAGEQGKSSEKGQPQHSNAALTAMVMQVPDEVPVTAVSSMPRQPLEAGALRQCLVANLTPESCSSPRGVAVLEDSLANHVKQRNQGLVIDPARYVCDSQRCYASVGGLAVYSLSSKIHSAFAQSATGLITASVRTSA